MADTLSDYRKFAQHLADAAREETLTRFRAGGEVFNKAGIWFDPVTDADREAERLLTRRIKAMYPKHGIIGEEFGAHNSDADYRWVLDPVDGTRAFICGVASWTTLIALEHSGVPVISVIDQPFTDERWVAEPGVTHYIHQGLTATATTSSVEQLSKARLSTTDPRRTAYFSTAEATAFEALDKKTRVSRLGLDAYGYALLAIGQLDLIVESGLQHYDYAALIPVIRGAGGVVTDWEGNPPGTDDTGRVLAAATPALHAEALAHLHTVA